MKIRIILLLAVMLVGLTFVSNGWAPGPTTYKSQHVGS